MQGGLRRDLLTLLTSYFLIRGKGAEHDKNDQSIALMESRKINKRCSLRTLVAFTHLFQPWPKIKVNYEQSKINYENNISWKYYIMKMINYENNKL